MARAKMGMGLVGLAAVGGVAWYLWDRQKKQQAAAAAAAQAAAGTAPGPGGTGAAVAAVISNLTQAAGQAYDIYQQQQSPGVAGFGARPLTVKRGTPTWQDPKPGTLTMVSTPSMPAPRTLSGSGFGQMGHWHPGQLYQGGTHDTSSGVRGLWF